MTLQFSEHYEVRFLNEDDTGEIYHLCSQNRLYFEYCPPFVSEESIRQDMHALPPGKDDSDKYYAGYFDHGRLIAVLDLIFSYPDEKTAFIGFFMTDVSVQNRGVGSEIVQDLCAYLKDAGMNKVRLAWVSGNPQASHFWHKNGFMETGEAYQTERYTLRAAERILAD